MARPRLFETSAWDRIQSDVSLGSYHFFSNLSNVPEELSRFVGVEKTDDQRPQSKPEDFRGLMTMVSLTTQNPPTIGNMSVATSSPVVRIRRFRVDEAATGSHQNVDDTLLFQPSDHSCVVKLSYRDEKEHFESLSTDAGLDGFLRKYNLDGIPERGTIESLRERGALDHFSTGSGT